MGKNDKKISEILDGMLRGTDRFSNNYRKSNMEKVWRSTFGEAISKYTTKIYLKDQKLTVYISSASLRQELAYHKNEILLKLNKNLKQLQIIELSIK